jgi:hypothetical protein
VSRRFAILLLCAGLSSCAGRRSDALTAQDILARMRGTYASAAHYDDEGNAYDDRFSLYTVFKSIFGQKSVSTFETHFDRPAGSLRFRFDRDEVRQANPDALLDFRPLSHRASLFAPLLLLGGAPSLDHPQREDDDTVHGVRCYVITATSSAGMKLTLWIEHDRFVIRRVRQVHPSTGEPAAWVFDYRLVRL